MKVHENENIDKKPDYSFSDLEKYLKNQNSALGARYLGI